VANNKSSATSPKKKTLTGQDMSVGIVVSDWNTSITKALLKGALNTLKKNGVQEKNIIIKHVPGSFELPLGAQLIEESFHPDAIICLGCVIKGETSHYDYICSSVSEGIMQLNLKFSKPFIFGVLTCNDNQQAIDRAGGIIGNKGEEAAHTAIAMVALKLELSPKKS
jgi:6,7-dimethyl-8-ribityllumazine synthase